SGDSLVSDSDGFSIYRELFDKALVDRAISSGVKFSSKTDAISTIRKKDLWEVTTSKGTVRSRAVILAAGPTSRLNSMFGLSGNKDLMKAVGMKIPIRDGSEVMEFYTMSKLKGGYGWWFPRGKEVNAGFCSDCDNMSLLHGLLRSKGVPKEITGSYHGGVMPHGGPIERFTGEQVVAVGDCGGFCHPVSKGGIHCALLSGSMGAEAIVRTLSGEVGALNDLVKQIKDHPAFSHKNIDRRDFLASLSDKDLNALTSIAGGRNLRTINKAVALKKALKYPNLVGIAMKGLKMVLDDKRWIDHTF
ncbi:MAG: NAD(P)/FAD-dependent oxidoreductase, partial [Candidatus Thermoplasmatota archaeon]|nr:NAD(P)/FAD-dependent oxidoreductase [Candidatus Thermoplasmatota archaeon]